MEFVEKVKGILTEPSKTFDALKGETLGDSMKYYAVIAAISAALNALLFALVFGTMFGQLGTMMGAGKASGATGAIIFSVILFILQIIWVFIGGAIFHIFVYLAGGRKGLTQTIKAVMYGSTPGLLFAWIPIIGVLAGIWSLVLEVLGIRQLHEMTTGRAVMAFVMILVVIVILTLVLAAVIAAFVFGLGSAGPR